MNEQHFAAAVIQHISEVVRREPIVHRHDDRASLRNGVELLEMLMRVRRDGADAIPRAYPELDEGCGPTIAALAELIVRETQRAIDDSLARAIEFSSAA